MFYYQKKGIPSENPFLFRKEFKVIGTSALSGGERLGQPNLSPLQNLLIFLFIFSFFWIMQLFECI